MNVSGDLLLILTENAAEDILEAYEPNPWRLPHEEAMDKALKIFNEKVANGVRYQCIVSKSASLGSYEICIPALDLVLIGEPYQTPAEFVVDAVRPRYRKDGEAPWSKTTTIRFLDPRITPWNVKWLNDQFWREITALPTQDDCAKLLNGTIQAWESYFGQLEQLVRQGKMSAETVQRQRKAIDYLLEGNAANKNLVTLLSNSDIYFKTNSPSHTEDIQITLSSQTFVDTTLNSGQKQAVASAMQVRDLHLIQSPPSQMQSKMAVIAEICAQAARQGKNPRSLTCKSRCW